MCNQETPVEATVSLSLDAIYDILAHQHRRSTIACLDEHGPLALPDLADEVARYEHDGMAGPIPEDEVRRVHSSLRHAHLPKLAEADVVSHDQDRDIVTLAENADVVERLLPPEAAECEEAA